MPDSITPPLPGRSAAIATSVPPPCAAPVAEPPGRPIRVLVVTACVADARQIGDRLARARPARFAIERAQDLRTGLARLGEHAHDLCLVDQQLPDGEGLDLIQAARRRHWQTPIILLAARPSAAVDVQALALGVADLLDRRDLASARLERSIRFALVRQQHAARLSRLAHHDQLTGLANRPLFEDRLERALAWARRHERLVAVMVLDLNGFKTINDRLGHAAGDRLLSLIAARLTGRLRETDTVARLGGDEFALVIENLARPEHAALVARKLLDAVGPPATVDGHTVMVTASLGVALYPRDGRGGAGLVRAADHAMYRAKTEGGSCCRFSSPQLDRRVQREALVESDVRRGLEGAEFILHFQPQVRLVPGRLGIACLPRWQHPELGLIGPERFLPLVESAGLLESLTERLFAMACAQGRQWRGLGATELHLAIPLLSRRQLARSDLAARLTDGLTRAGLPASCIEIELDEDMLLSETDAGGAGLAALKGVGVRLALDRFGHGLTSLRGLQLGILDTLKIARELHEAAAHGPRGRALVGTVIALGRELGLRVVAESVDRQEQLAVLRAAGCHAVQALLSCPPLPAEACTSWLRQVIDGRRPPAAPTAGPPRLPMPIESDLPQRPRLASTVS